MTSSEHHEHDLDCAPLFCKHCDTLKWGCEFYQGDVSICKACYKARSNTQRQLKLKTDPDAREKYNARMREYNANLSEEKYITRQVKLYGLTYDDYLIKMKEQDGKCAICKTAFPPFVKGERRPIHIDHNHETGISRGILCPNCNLLIGHAKERIAVLVSAVEYLLRYEGGQ